MATTWGSANPRGPSIATPGDRRSPFGQREPSPAREHPVLDARTTAQAIAALHDPDHDVEELADRLASYAPASTPRLYERALREARRIIRGVG